MRFKASVFPLAAALALSAAGCKDAGDTDTGPTRIGGTDSASRSRDPLASRTSSSGGSGLGSGSAPSNTARPADPTRAGQGASGLASAGGEQQSVTGTLAQASADEVKVDSASQPGLKLKVNKSTRITVDGKDASASDLREGAQVRASYQGSGDSATAIRIEAKSAKGSSETTPPSAR